MEVLKALRTHPAVVWCERMNSGVARIGGRFVRLGWLGCPDVLVAWLLWPATVSTCCVRFKANKEVQANDQDQPRQD